MGSVEDEKDNKEEEKEKLKNNYWRREKSKDKNADEEEVLDIKTDLKKSRSDFAPPH